ncbi:MAG: ankyrin repeat domain-containing protein, partial [Xanthomonadales bacterium]|nr:ankyrin repeat domain-containing protein [Xanthomonadales bacterium]
NRGDRYGDHALNWACYFGHADFVALMLRHGADLTRTGQTDDQPLEIALREKHAAVVELLRAAGAVARPGKGGGAP